MTSGQVEIQLIAVVTAVACALPGVFLVLRRMALMADAISHVVLLGIVVGFLATGSLSSPWLVAGAALSGLFTVAAVEAISRTGLVKRDAAIGLVFPVLFSVAVILVSRLAGDVHLDVDAVLLGELAFAPFDRLVIGGSDIGPRGLYSMLAVLAVNVALLVLFFKELKLATFDSGLAAALGFAPAVIHYGLMAAVSITAVEAFDAVGSILVVALMITPPATAWLLTDSLSRMLWLSITFAAAGALAGYWVSYFLDASIAGCMASVLGLIFCVVYLLAPGRGLVALLLRRRRHELGFGSTMLAIHLLQHENLPDENRENRVAHLHEHLRWTDSFAMSVVRFAEREDLILRSGAGQLNLTEKGRTQAREAMVT